MTLYPVVLALAERAKRRIRYIAHEMKIRVRGDTRDEFERKVDRCRILKLPDIIENMAGIPDGGT